MFKLNRMEHLALTDEAVPERAVPMPEFNTTQFFPANVRLKARFDPSMKWHLIETYGALSFQVQEDGSLLFEMELDEEGAISWLLSCRDQVTVLEPKVIRERLLNIASEIEEKYRESGRT